MTFNESGFRRMFFLFRQIMNSRELFGMSSNFFMFGMNPWIQIRKFYELKIVIILLPINLNLCFGCSKEPSH